MDGNRNLLNLLSIAMIVILVLQLFIGSMKSMFALKTGQQIDARLILGYYKHLMKLPQQFFDTMRVGEIISRINDAVKIRAFINDAATGLVVNVFIVLFSFGMMFTYDWKLAMIMLAVIPFYGIIYLIVNKLNKKYQRTLMEDAAELESQLVESLNAMGTIKRFGLEEFANVKTETRFVKLLKTIFTSARNSVWSGNATEIVSRLFTIVLLWVGSGFVIDNQITPGELLSILRAHCRRSPVRDHGPGTRRNRKQNRTEAGHDRRHPLYRRVVSLRYPDAGVRQPEPDRATRQNNGRRWREWIG